MKIAFCFDLDGTLTKEEILPQIAKKVGIYEEIDLLTNITMQGLITFDKSFKLRVKLLSSIPISEVKEVVNEINIDEKLQGFIQKHKENCFIITGNLDVWVKDFIHVKYGCYFYSSIAEARENQLIGITHTINKADAVKELRKEYDYIVSIGDGMNDCSMFEKSDKSIAYGGVHQPVLSLIKSSDYVCYDSTTLINLLESINNSFHENK